MPEQRNIPTQLFASLNSIRTRVGGGSTTLTAEETLLLADEVERWQERTRYLLTTDPSEWQPEIIQWLK